ncbi:MAG: glycosyltransferase [Chloroflexi bacterium]|nr:glycosyltransferase [Chloroflexota bacterium]
MELSVVIPALHEAENLARLLPQLHTVLSSLGEGQKPAGQGGGYEIIVVDNHSTDGTAEVCAAEKAALVHQTEPGYGGALWAGFERASGEYILTMDADLSHVPNFIPTMWQHRDNAELVIASRYVEGGRADMPKYRHVLSVILNQVYSRALSLPVQDLSSGFRLYRSSILKNLDLRSHDFDALEEILIKCYAAGCKILEVPFHYVPRHTGKSKVKLLQFGLSYLRTLLRMWKLRNSISSADYDARAFDSPIPLQRYWQRRRHKIVTQMADARRPSLDIGCGSSRILSALAEHTIGLDIDRGKLLYARRYGRPLVQGSVFTLPFPAESFEQIVCSEVIEHLPSSPQPFLEIARVLKDGGHLILGTPDYGRLSWLIIERLYKIFAPDAYGDQHITHYRAGELVEFMKTQGFQFKRREYVAHSEVILLFEKTGED